MTEDFGGLGVTKALDFCRIASSLIRAKSSSIAFKERKTIFFVFALAAPHYLEVPKRFDGISGSRSYGGFVKWWDSSRKFSCSLDEVRFQKIQL